MGLKFGNLKIQGFLESLITNASSEFRNSKWRIHYGGRKGKKLLDWDEIWYAEVFGVADYESELKFRNSKCRMQYGGPKCRKGFFAAYIF